MNITFITGNSGKLEQFRAVLEPEIQVQNINLNTPEMQTLDMVAISQDKALEAFKQLQTPVIVDDAGVYLDAYKDFPGVWSKYAYHTLGKDGFHGLLSTTDNTRGFLRCVVSYMDDTLDKPISFIWEEWWNWSFDTDIIATDSLPYDTYFYPDHLDGSVADNYELWKQGVGHRWQAVQKFKDWFLSK